jgi:hypothetical protein
MEKLTLEGKISWVLGLVVECPLQDPTENCPAKKLRGLPLNESASLLSNMEEQQLDEIISFHRQCLWEREGNLLGRDG